MQKDIKKMDVIELKALAYDQMAMIEQCQVNIRGINAEIAGRNGQMDKRETAIKEKK